MFPLSITLQKKISRSTATANSQRNRQKPFASVFDWFDPLIHQRTFIDDYQTRNIALVAGYGAGKTKALLYKLIDLAHRNTGYSGGLYAPTAELARDVLIPELDAILDQCGISYDYSSSPNPSYKLHFADGSTTILVRSMENWKRIVGNNFAFACVDEIDTIKSATAQIAWKKIMGRMRAGKIRQIATTSTPEGHKFLYKWFEKGAKEGRRLIRAKTTDNPHLPEDFVEDLMSNYDPQLIKAYLNGEFVNLTSGTIYGNFDRLLNASNETAREDDILYIGMDFNVNKMAAVVHVLRNGQPHAIDELTKIDDTPSMIQALRSKYNQQIIIYPDASGQNTSSKAASVSDLSLLKQAGFRVKVNSRNPFVKDRIASVQRSLLNGNGDRIYRVNIDRCPNVVESLEQQIYTDQGVPDKSQDLDHVADALGYFISHLLPIQTREMRQSKYIQVY